MPFLYINFVYLIFYLIGLIVCENIIFKVVLILFLVQLELVVNTDVI